MTSQDVYTVCTTILAICGTAVVFAISFFVIMFIWRFTRNSLGED
jgi:type IV secretory pathway VirB6-like protein